MEQKKAQLQGSSLMGMHYGSRNGSAVYRNHQ